MESKTYTLSELAAIKYGKNQKKVISDNGTVPIYGTGGLMGYATESLGIEGEFEGIGHLALGYPDGALPKASPRRECRTYIVE